MDANFSNYSSRSATNGYNPVYDLTKLFVPSTELVNKKNGGPK